MKILTSLIIISS